MNLRLGRINRPEPGPKSTLEYAATHIAAPFLMVFPNKSPGTRRGFLFIAPERPFTTLGPLKEKSWPFN
jgi:hypothetical protein